MSVGHFASAPSEKFISSISDRKTSAGLSALITRIASCSPIFRIDESPDQLCIMFTADGGKRYSAFMTFIIRSGIALCAVSKKDMYAAMDNFGCFSFDSSDYWIRIHNGCLLVVYLYQKLRKFQKCV